MRARSTSANFDFGQFRLRISTWANFWMLNFGTTKCGALEGWGGGSKKKWTPEGWSLEGWSPEGWVAKPRKSGGPEAPKGGAPKAEGWGSPQVGLPKGGVPKGGVPEGARRVGPKFRAIFPSSAAVSCSFLPLFWSFSWNSGGV